MRKPTKYQLWVLRILNDGGKIFEFIYTNEYGLDDKDDNSYAFSSSSFKSMYSKGLIRPMVYPSDTVIIYGITKKGMEAIK